jgi:hypothetical protein
LVEVEVEVAKALIAVRSEQLEEGKRREEKVMIADRE